MKKKISVFIASPGDLSNERKLFREAINELNIGFGDGANVEFEALGWEDTLASTGRRNQSVINEEIDKCQVFILVLNRRWGQEAPDSDFSSYTEEEFHRALEHLKKDGAPEIFVFFKRVDPESEGDPGPQLKKLMDFRRQLEESRSVLYHYFNDNQSFKDEIDKHLRAYAKDDLPKTTPDKNLSIYPLDALQAVKEAQIAAAEKTKEAQRAQDAENAHRLKLIEIQLQTAEDAAELSKEGKIEFARQKFASLITETIDIRVLYLAYEFYDRTGDLDSAQTVLEKWLTLSGKETMSSNTASAYGNLGNIYLIRSELKRAEEMYKKSLAINEALGHKEGMATDYGNLGNIYQTRGELGCAEDMYKKSLAINEALGRKEGVANQYGNLGNIYLTRSEHERAKDMFEKSLAINEALGRKEGVANQYGNLGNIYLTLSEHERAEDMYEKSLAINEALGRKEGMATDYGNLGNIYLTRSELERAKDMFEKSLAINEALGRKEGVANQYGNLGKIYLTRSEIERAEDMFEKSLAINEALGCKEGVANQYGNLGNIYLTRSEHERAKDMFEKSLAINEALGRKEGVANQYGNLGNIYLTLSEHERAEDMFEKSIVIFTELQSPNAQIVSGWLDKLREQNSDS